MTRLRLAVLLFLFWLPLQAAHVNFQLSDFTAQPQRVRQLLLFPVGAPYTNGAGQIITRDRITVSTGTNGSVTVSNIFPGAYRSELVGTTTGTTNYYVFPATNATVINASDWTTNQNAAIPQQWDIRFWQKAVLGPGNNVTFSTNGSAVTINGAAASSLAPTNTPTSGYILSATPPDSQWISVSDFAGSLTNLPAANSNLFVLRTNGVGHGRHVFDAVQIGNGAAYQYLTNDSTFSVNIRRDSGALNFALGYSGDLTIAGSYIGNGSGITNFPLSGLNTNGNTGQGQVATISGGSVIWSNAPAALTGYQTNLFTTNTSAGTTNAVRQAVNGATVTNLTVVSNLAVLWHQGIATPYPTISAGATAAAVAGDSIVVGPGTYNNESNLLKGGVSYHFYGNPLVYCTNGAGGSPWGIWDDRQVGAVTSTVSGDAIFRYDNYTNLNVYGTIVLTNKLTVLNLEADQLQFSSVANLEGPAANQHEKSAVMIQACQFADIHAKRIVNPLYTNRLVVGAVTNGQNCSAVTWWNGETHINVDSIGSPGYTIGGFPAGFFYGVWAAQNNEIGDTNGLYVTANLIESHCYINGGVTNTWRTWWDVKEMRRGFSAYDAGKHYLRAEKIGSGLYGAALDLSLFTANGEMWIDCQKVTANRYLGVSDRAVSIGGGTVWLRALHYEDAAKVADTTGLVYNSGGTVYFQEGALVAENRPGLQHSGGTSYVDSMNILTRTNTWSNFPVLAESTGLTLKNCILKSGSAVSNSINAGANEDLGTINVAVLSVGASTNVSNTIGKSPSGGFSVGGW